MHIRAQLQPRTTTGHGTRLACSRQLREPFRDTLHLGKIRQIDVHVGLWRGGLMQSLNCLQGQDLDRDILGDDGLSLTRWSSLPSTEADMIVIGVKIKVAKLVIGACDTRSDKGVATAEGGGRDCERQHRHIVLLGEPDGCRGSTQCRF